MISSLLKSTFVSDKGLKNWRLGQYARIINEAIFRIVESRKLSEAKIESLIKNTDYSPFYEAFVKID